MSNLPETAFMISRLRALDPELSRDPWAKLWADLWKTKTAERFEREMVSKHVPGDPVAICLRNRYFLESLLSFEKEKGSIVFFNIGAGLTTYPYWLQDKNIAIEVDLPKITEFKKAKLEEFEKKGQVPKREIRFVTLDVEEPTARDALKELIQEYQKEGPFFVLLEGVLFSLGKETVDSLFQLFGASLPKGSQVACSVLPPEIKNSQGIENLREFHESEFYTDFDKFTWIGKEYFHNLNQLTVLEETDYSKLEKIDCQKQKGFSPENSVFESFYRLIVKDP